MISNLIQRGGPGGTRGRGVCIDQIYERYGYERNECVVSNPIFSGQRMYVRGELYLYCIEKK